MSPAPDDDAVFEGERARLLGLAYRMVGVVADAEDIVQDAWLRWSAADRDRLERPEAWLTTVTTRLAIDRLRAQQRTREHYMGPWLPEPLVHEPGPADRAELADSLTLGFLTLLDRLNPVERAVLLMADVFSVPFAQIAAVVDKSPQACGQIASRARRTLRAAHHPPRLVDRRVVDGLVTALSTGNMDAVLASLAPEVVCVTDGGAVQRAARYPVIGAHRVARFLSNLARRYQDQLSVTPVNVNGEPGVVARLDGVVDFVAAFEVQDDRITTIRLIRNRDKLSLVESEVRLV